MSCIAYCALRTAVSDDAPSGTIKDLCRRYQGDELGEVELRRELASIFYKTGIVGVKPTAHSQVNWANSESYSVSPAEIGEDSSISIHPGLWKVLGIDQLND